MALVRITSLAELPPGTMLPTQVDGKELVLCNDNGTVHALDGLCPHRNGPLSQGNFIDGRLICPWHAWEFRCDSGCYDYNPDIALAKYTVVIQGEDVFVDA